MKDTGYDVNYVNTIMYNDVETMVARNIRSYLLWYRTAKQNWTQFPGGITGINSTYLKWIVSDVDNQIYGLTSMNDWFMRFDYFTQRWSVVTDKKFNISWIRLMKQVVVLKDGTWVGLLYDGSVYRGHNKNGAPWTQVPRSGQVDGICAYIPPS
jgi:hypothetical protein